MRPDEVCTRSDHPSRRHWHYGYGDRNWCTDPYSALLFQNGSGRGPAYIRRETEEAER